MNARESKEARAIIPEATIALTSSHSRDTPRSPVTPHSPGFLFLARAGQLRAARLRAIPFSRQLRDCHKVSTCQVKRTQVTSHYPP